METNINDEQLTYLPIGSIILLKEGQKKLMVTGYAQIDMKRKNGVYDYSGVPYPNGMANTNNIYLFNHNDIKKIFFKGYVDEEEMVFQNYLKEIINDDRKRKILDELK